MTIIIIYTMQALRVVLSTLQCFFGFVFELPWCSHAGSLLTNEEREIGWLVTL